MKWVHICCRAHELAGLPDPSTAFSKVPLLYGEGFNSKGRVNRTTSITHFYYCMGSTTVSSALQRLKFNSVMH
jgi:hypothetical protein